MNLKNELRRFLAAEHVPADRAGDVADAFQVARKNAAAKVGWSAVKRAELIEMRGPNGESRWFLRGRREDLKKAGAEEHVTWGALPIL